MSPPERTEMYKIWLNNELNEVCVPWDVIHCHNVHFDDTTHIELVNKFDDDIVSACLAASDKHIPRSKHANHTSCGIILGWTDLVEPYRERTIFGTIFGRIMDRQE